MSEKQSRDYFCYFPKGSCYPNQEKAMNTIFDAILKNKFVLFEGACGTGKTLSALAPSLCAAKQCGKMVIIATNVRQQMVQFIEEARDIKKKQNDVNAIVLRGKMTICPKNFGMHEKDFAVDYDECEYLRKNTDEFIEASETEDRDTAEFLKEWQKEHRKEICEEYLNAYIQPEDVFRAWLFSGVRTPDEIAGWSKSKDVCAYELLKRVMHEADILICNYRHVLDEHIFKHISTLLKREPDQIIGIFDEAHNIEHTVRSFLSENLPERTIEDSLYEVDKYNRILSSEDAKHIKKFLTILLDSMRSTYNQCLTADERKLIGNDWRDIRIADPEVPAEKRTDLFSDIFFNSLENEGIESTEAIESLKEFGMKVRNQKKRSGSLAVARFLPKYIEFSHKRSYYPIMNVKKDKNDEHRIIGRLEIFNVLPNIVTGPLINSFHSGVLMSATLAPFNVFKKTLGITRETSELILPMAFPKENRRTFAVAIEPLFSKERNSLQTIEDVKSALEDIIESSDGNVLIFFQNHEEALRYKSILKCDAPVFLNEVGVSAQAVRDDFFSMGEKGKKAVLISYMWGTLTEGVDYKDDRARTVVIVGVGYPTLDDKCKAVESAYKAEFGHGWDYAIGIPTIRKVRQAMGRVIRSPDDYGARILLDLRYVPLNSLGKYSVFYKFPKEERVEIVGIGRDFIKQALIKFFNGVNDKKRNKVRGI